MVSVGLVYHGTTSSVKRQLWPSWAGAFVSALMALLMHATMLIYGWPSFVLPVSPRSPSNSVMEIFSVASDVASSTTAALAPTDVTPAQVAPVKVAIQADGVAFNTVATDTVASAPPRRTAKHAVGFKARPPLADVTSEAVSPAPPAPLSIQSTNSTEPILVKTPQFLVPPSKPVYPPVAYRRGQQGTVWLEILLSETGKQVQLSVMRSSGFSSLDDAAKVAVADWQLAPYRMNGVAVLSRVQVPVAFVIQ